MSGLDIVEKYRSFQWLKMKPADAIKLQKELSNKVVIQDSDRVINAKLLMAFDISAKGFGKMLYCAGVLWDLQKNICVDVIRVSRETDFPYIPGLLSFREMPVMLDALAKSKDEADILLCDSQGLAHPRFFGLACHIGVVTSIPSIGCAKSHFVGEYREPGRQKGNISEMVFKGRRVGYALRSAKRCKPIYVSPGHLISCETAVKVVISLLDGFRIPAPLRRAHIEAISFMREKEVYF